MARDRTELVDQLRRQVGFLRRSADDFDDGHEDEAVRMATTVRVLVHNTPRSRALLTQLGVLDTLSFVDTSVDQGVTQRRLPDGSIELKQTVSPGGMASIWATGDGRLSFHAACVDAGRRKPFADWWTTAIVPASRPYEPPPLYDAITRKSLVLTMANQDGGAHVDPELDVHYAAFLAKQHGVPFDMAASSPIDGSPALITMREIAFEVLLTLDEAGLR